MTKKSKQTIVFAKKEVPKIITILEHVVNYWWSHLSLWGVFSNNSDIIEKYEHNIKLHNFCLSSKHLLNDIERRTLWWSGTGTSFGSASKIILLARPWEWFNINNMVLQGGGLLCQSKDKKYDFRRQLTVCDKMMWMTLLNTVNVNKILIYHLSKSLWVIKPTNLCLK